MGTALTADAGAATESEPMSPDPASATDFPGSMPSAGQIKWPGQTEGSETSTEDATEAATGTEETPDPASPEAETPAEIFSLEVPLPNTDGKDRGNVVLELPSQEVADTLKHHARLASKVPALEQKLDQYTAEAQTLAYIREHPDQGLGWLAQQFPQAAEQFLSSAIATNPMAAAQQLTAMGFQVQLLHDEETISVKSKLAQYEQAEKLRTGQQQFTQHQVASQFAQTAAGVVEDLTQTMGISPDHPRYSMFAAAAQDEFRKLYQASPRAGAAQMTTALTPLVTEFQHMIAEQAKRTTLKAKLATEQPRDPAGQFAAQAAKTDKFRKLAGGQTIVSAISATKVKPGETLDDTSARLRAMGSKWA